MVFKSASQRKAVMAKYKVYDNLGKYWKTIKLPVKGTKSWAKRLNLKIKKLK